MPLEDSLGDRMKGYEKQADFTLPPGQPVMLRLDGNSFSKLTRSLFEFPFDDKFKESMLGAATATIDYCQGKVAFVQSDEISILLGDRGGGNELLKNRVQKVCSIAASTCAVEFSKLASASTGKDVRAAFDCRCFAIPEGEVINYFIWRQIDAMKNAVNSIYHWKLRETMGAKAAGKEADGMTQDKKVAALLERGITIGQYPSHYIRGALVYKQTIVSPIEEVAPAEVIEKYNKKGQLVTRHKWFVDKGIPVFAETGYLRCLLGLPKAGRAG